MKIADWLSMIKREWYVSQNPQKRTRWQHKTQEIRGSCVKRGDTLVTENIREGDYSVGPFLYAKEILYIVTLSNKHEKEFDW